MWAHVHVSTCVCVGGGQTLTLGIILHMLSTLYLKRVSHWPGSSPLGEAAWLLSPRDSPISTSLELELKACITTSGFCFCVSCEFWGIALDLMLTMQQALYQVSHLPSPQMKSWVMTPILTLVTPILTAPDSPTAGMKCRAPESCGTYMSSLRHCSKPTEQLLSLLPSYRNGDQDARRWNGFPNIP